MRLVEIDAVLEKEWKASAKLCKSSTPDSKLGARPLARIIDEEIKKPLSKMILFGELTDGGMVEVDVSDDTVPALTIQFKAKKDLKKITETTLKNEKTS